MSGSSIGVLLPKVTQLLHVNYVVGVSLLSHFRKALQICDKTIIC